MKSSLEKRLSELLEKHSISLVGGAKEVMALLKGRSFPFEGFEARLQVASERMPKADSNLLLLLTVHQFLAFQFLPFERIDELLFALDLSPSPVELTEEATLRLLPEIFSYLVNDEVPYAELGLSPVEIEKDYKIWESDDFQKLVQVFQKPSALAIVRSSDLYEDLCELKRAATSAKKNLVRLTSRAADPVRVTQLLQLTESAVVASDLESFQLVSRLADEVPVFLLVDANVELPEAILLRPFYELSPEKERTSFWRKEAAERKLSIDENVLERLDSVFPYSLFKVEKTLDEVQLMKAPQLDFLSISSICRKHSSRSLQRFAKKISPIYKLKDLVVPHSVKLRIAEIQNYILTRSKCEADFGYRKAHSRGHGVTVLFEGQSGTGKTMAAEAIAGELGMDLYRVDLANVTSKYVGETEKNLSRIFSAAKEAAGILLFDEGEALFSKRSEVTSSQDRYANLEVNFLLQEIEAFDGIVIISTNLGDLIDTAFLRRITFEVQFPRPDKEARLQIWKMQLGDKTSKIDLDLLSSLSISGGFIRNIVRQAAALASYEKREILMEDLLHAVRREFQKAQIPLDRDLFGDRYWRIVSPDWEMATAKQKMEKGYLQ